MKTRERKSSKCPKEDETNLFTIGNPINYEGADLLSSVESLVTSTVDMFCAEAGLQHKLPDSFIKDIRQLYYKFYDAFFTECFNRESTSQRSVSYEEAKDFCDRCKEQAGDLSRLIALISSEGYNMIDKDLFLFLNDIEKNSHPYILPVSRMKYLPNHLKSIICCYHGDFEIEPVFYFTLKREPRFYVYLYGILFRMLSVLSEVEVDFHSNFVPMWLTIPLSAAEVFQLTNASVEEVNMQAQELYEILTAPSTPIPESTQRLLDSVISDIKSDKPKPYVRDLHNIFINDGHNKPLITEEDWKFQDGDYYVTMKATATRIELTKADGTKKWISLPAIFSSCAEVDTIKGIICVREFDSFTEYQSYYRTIEALRLQDYQIKTIWIPNPSKRKYRAIHIASNYIQDRCNIIQRVCSKALRAMKCDAMRNHQLGVDFLRRVTKPDFRYRNKNSVFGSDYSSATDTLSQDFQMKVIEALLPPQICKFWDYLCKMPKTMLVREPGKNDLTEIPYQQTNGQPQGLLGSFVLFSLAHHVLMRMLMKKHGLELTRPEDFYIIVGDDSVVSYPADKGDIFSSHTELVTSVNLKKNVQKSAQSYYHLQSDSFDHEVIDFAKISIYDGNFASAIPPGLLSNYSKSFKDKLSVVLWFNSRGVQFSKWLHYLVLTSFSGKPWKFAVIEAIINSQQVPYLAGLEIPSYHSNGSLFEGTCLFSYDLVEIRNSIFGFFFNDEAKRDFYEGKLSFDEIWNNIMRPDKYADLIDSLTVDLDSHHKMMEILTDAAKLTSDLKDLYDTDFQYMSIIDSLVKHSRLQAPLQDLLDKYNSILHLLKDEEDTGYQSLSEALSGYDRDWQITPEERQEIDSIQVRSFREKSGNQARFLQSTLNVYHKLFQFNDDINDSYWEYQTEIYQLVSNFLGVSQIPA